MFSFLTPKIKWMTLFILIFIMMAVVLMPVWIIYPFRSQSRQGLELAYFLRRWSPLITLVLLPILFFVGFQLWRDSRRWWRKVVLVGIFIITPLLTWFANQNHFEWMFHPLSNPSYVRTSEANFVADTDMVMGVEIGGDAVAYPIRQLAYHHLVQDVVGGTRIVATY